MKLSGETGWSGFAGFGYAVSGYRDGRVEKKRKTPPQIAGVCPFKALSYGGPTP